MTTLDRTPAHLIDMLARQIIGLRNILAHGYEQVDHETLYRTVTGELAAVEHALATCLGNLDDA